MPDSLKVVARVIGWTLVQGLAFVLCYELGKAAVSAVHDWRPDLGRGILWLSYLGGFIGLALLANALLEVERIGAHAARRLALWAVVLALLVLYTLPSWSSLPLAVPFAHACAVLAVIAREGFGRLALPQRLSTSG